VLPSPSQVHHWTKNLRLTLALLVLWAAVTFGVAFFARDLSFRFFGWPFSYWMAAQGALTLYVAMVGVYASAMDGMDDAHGLADDKPEV